MPSLNIEGIDFETTLTKKFLARKPWTPRDASALLAAMPGVVRELLVAPGDVVAEGQPVAVVEAMKMQNRVAATVAGTVRAVGARVGEMVSKGQLLLTVEPWTEPVARANGRAA